MLLCLLSTRFQTFMCAHNICLHIQAFAHICIRQGCLSQSHIDSITWPHGHTDKTYRQKENTSNIAFFICFPFAKSNGESRQLEKNKWRKPFLNVYLSTPTTVSPTPTPWEKHTHHYHWENRYPHPYPLNHSGLPYQSHSIARLITVFSAQSALLILKSRLP